MSEYKRINRTFRSFFSSMREHKLFFSKKKSNITSILNVSFDGHGDFPQSESKPSYYCLFI